MVKLARPDIASKGPPEVGDSSSVDRWLIRLGMSLAACSVAFAGLMISFRGAPRVYGIEHLAIFAQPNRSIRVASSGRLGGSSPESPSVQVDPTPTGSISPQSPEIDPHDREVIAVSDDTAWIRSADTIVAVRIGQYVKGLGRLASIARRDGEWLLLDEAGATLLSQDKARSDPLSRRTGKALIFAPEK